MWRGDWPLLWLAVIVVFVWVLALTGVRDAWLNWRRRRSWRRRARERQSGADPPP